MPDLPYLSCSGYVEYTECLLKGGRLCFDGIWPAFVVAKKVFRAVDSMGLAQERKVEEVLLSRIECYRVQAGLEDRHEAPAPRSISTNESRSESYHLIPQSKETL